MSRRSYDPVGDETRARLWPEPAERPAVAWTHDLCELVVTNRASHEERNGPHECPVLSRMHA